MVVTCIMSIYINDREEWVRDAVSSILHGNELPYEFLIYCDGPIKYDVRLLLLDFCRIYKWIKLYEEDTNKGRAYSRQFLIKKAKGDYIMLMDADDVSMPDRLKMQRNHAIANPDLDLIGGYIVEFSTAFGQRLRKVPLLNSEIRSAIKYSQPINHVTLFAKKNILVSVGGYIDAGNCEDFYLIARCIVEGARLANLPEVLVKVRIDENFVNRRRGWQIGVDEFRVISYLKKSKYVNVFEFLIFGFYRLLVRNLPSWLIGYLYSINRSKHS